MPLDPTALRFPGAERDALRIAEMDRRLRVVEHRLLSGNTGAPSGTDVVVGGDLAGTSANAIVEKSSAVKFEVGGYAVFGGTADHAGTEPIEAQGTASGISLWDRAWGSGDRWVIFPEGGDLKFWTHNIVKVQINGIDTDGVIMTLRGNSAGVVGPNLVLLNEAGGPNTATALDFFTTTVNSGIPQARLSTVDDGNHGNHIVFSNKLPGASTNALTERARITSDGHFNLSAGGQYRIGGSQISASNLANGVTGSGSIVLAGSPALTGTPTAPTPASGDNSTQIATTAFVKAQGYLTAGPANMVTTDTTQTISGEKTFQAASGATKLVIKATSTQSTSRIFEIQPSGSVTPIMYVDGAGMLVSENRIILNNSAGSAAADAITTKIGYIAVQQASGTDFAYATRIGVGSARWLVNVLGKQEFGDAAGSARDTTLERGAAGVIKITNTVNATSGYQVNGTALASTHLSDSAALARLASPAFTGTPTAPTALVGENSTQIATTAWVKLQGYMSSAANMVTTDTSQTISGIKTMSVPFNIDPGSGTVDGRINIAGRNAGAQVLGLIAQQSDGKLVLDAPASGGVQFKIAGGVQGEAVGNGINVPTGKFYYVNGVSIFASPAFTGTPTAPTPATADDSTKLATTAWVRAQGYATSAGGAPDASTTVKGISKLSVAAAVASDPIVVGTNDPRVTADQAAGTASIRTIGTGALQAAAGNHTHANMATTDTAQTFTGQKTHTQNLKLDPQTGTAGLGVYLTPRSGGSALSDAYFLVDSAGIAAVNGGTSLRLQSGAVTRATVDSAGIDLASGLAYKINGTALASTHLTDSAALARLASPALTGTPTAPTPAAGDNDTSIATTAFVRTEASPAVVTSLPGSPYDGQVIRFQTSAMATEGIVWTLRYRSGSSSAYKWEVVGGSPLRASNATLTGLVPNTNWGDTQQAVADSAANVVTLPLAGDYYLSYGAGLEQTASGQHHIYFNIGHGGTGAATVMTNLTGDDHSHAYANQNDQFPVGVVNHLLTAQPSGRVLQFGYDASNTAARISLKNPYMYVMPKRVG